MNIETKIKEDAIYWLTCEKEGFKENQKAEFENWIKEEIHQKAYNRMKLVHQMAKSISKYFLVTSKRCFGTKFIIKRGSILWSSIEYQPQVS